MRVCDYGWTVKPDTDSDQSGEQQADCWLTKREAYSLCEAFHQPNPHAFFCGTYGDIFCCQSRPCWLCTVAGLSEVITDSAGRHPVLVCDGMWTELRRLLRQVTCVLGVKRKFGFPWPGYTLHVLLRAQDPVLRDSTLLLFDDRHCRGWLLTVLYTSWNVIILLCNVSLTFQFMFLSNCNRRECLNKTLFLNI